MPNALLISKKDNVEEILKILIWKLFQIRIRTRNISFQKHYIMTNKRNASPFIICCSSENLSGIVLRRDRDQNFGKRPGQDRDPFHPWNGTKICKIMDTWFLSQIIKLFNLSCGRIVSRFFRFIVFLCISK